MDLRVTGQRYDNLGRLASQKVQGRVLYRRQSTPSRRRGRGEATSRDQRMSHVIKHAAASWISPITRSNQIVYVKRLGESEGSFRPWTKSSNAQRSVRVPVPMSGSSVRLPWRIKYADTFKSDGGRGERNER